MSLASVVFRRAATSGLRARFLSSSVIQTPGSLTDEMRDKYVPLHPVLPEREQDNDGRGSGKPYAKVEMRPNLLFADADAGPLGPKKYNFATGEMPVVLGCADLASPPDSWVAAGEEFKREFDNHSSFRLATAKASGQIPSRDGPIAIAAE